MPTNIRVDVALAGLLKRLKDQQNAQRLAFLQKRENLTFEQQLAEVLKQQLPTQLLAQPKREPRKEELAAFRRETSGLTGFAFGWRGTVFVEDPNGNYTYDVLFSRDGSVSVALPDLSSLAFSARTPRLIPTVFAPDGPGFHFVQNGRRHQARSYTVEVPVDDKRFIYASVASMMLVDYSWLYNLDITTSPNTYTLLSAANANARDEIEFCYLVSESDIVPLDGGLLLPLLRYRLPVLSQEDYLVPVSLEADFFVPQSRIITTDPPNGTLRPFTRSYRYGSSFTSPTIFQWLNSIFNLNDYVGSLDDYVDIDAQFNTTKCTQYAELIDPETNGGLYQANLWDRPFTAPGQPTDVDPSAYRLPDKRVDITPYPVPESVSSILGYELIGACNWGAPDYCKQRLAAFGIFV